MYQVKLRRTARLLSCQNTTKIDSTILFLSCSVTICCRLTILTGISIGSWEKKKHRHNECVFLSQRVQQRAFWDAISGFHELEFYIKMNFMPFICVFIALDISYPFLFLLFVFFIVFKWISYFKSFHHFTLMRSNARHLRLANIIRWLVNLITMNGPITSNCTRNLVKAIIYNTYIVYVYSLSIEIHMYIK